MLKSKQLNRSLNSATLSLVVCGLQCRRPSEHRSDFAFTRPLAIFHLGADKDAVFEMQNIDLATDEKLKLEDGQV